MGFKRTSEGRVFFQSGQRDGGAQQDYNRAHDRGGDFDQGAAQAQAFNPPNISAPNQMQLQILGLLKSLNERLRATQADRDYLRSELETYKGLVHDLKRRSESLEDKVAAKAAPAAGKPGQAEKLASETLKELAETRKALAELEDRAEKTESDLKRQVAQIRQNETLIRQKQTELEQLQQAHQAEISRRIEDRSRELAITHNKQWEQLMARIEKREQAITLRIAHTEDHAKNVTEKVEEALANTTKLDRKVEKALQERTRFIRKLERIEETVIQTHDALNARAMVLLTDQNTATQSPYPHASAFDKKEDLPVRGFAPGDDEEAHAASRPEADGVSASVFNPLWWKKPLRLNAPAMTGILVVALLAGWGISQLQKPEMAFDIPVPPQQAELVRQADAFLEPDAPADDSVPSEIAAPAQEPAAGEADDAPGDAPAADFDARMDNFIQKGTASLPDDVAAKDDLGTAALTEQDKIEALLEGNPDAVAAALNAIEPGSAPAAADNARTEAALPVQEQPATAVKAAAPQVPAPAKSIPAGEIARRVKPDSHLPAVVKDIEAKAFEGSAEAQHDLAAIYTAGHGGVKQDYQRAAKWFEIAAEGGVANAAYNLGVLYHQGIGVKQDLKTALSWYQKAADKGHPEAQYNLGIAHIEGVGLSYDAEKAATYFENAARAGVMEAAYNLGLIYENGLLGSAQPDEALMWYKAAADKGSPEAKAALEHLARSLNVKLDEVNKLVDGMQNFKAGAAPKPVKTPAPVKASEEWGLYPDESSAVPLDPGPSPERTLTAGIQEQLMSFGLYPGPADGLSGPLTEDAIRSYQTAYGLEADGIASKSLLSHMMAQSVKAMTEGFVGAGNE